jgi:hypothetical protein
MGSMDTVDEGSRKIIELSGYRYYLLVFPHAQEDVFTIKFPYENRPDNEKERNALEWICQTANDFIAQLKSEHDEQIEELSDAIEEMTEEICKHCEHYKSGGSEVEGN